MLLVLYWMLMAACFFLTGFGALRTVSLSDSGSESTKGLPDTSIFTVIWLGAAVFTGLVQYLSLLGGIDRGMRLSVVCLLALYALIDRSAIRAFVSTKLSDSKRVLLPGFVVLIALLLFTITHASQGPHDYDMGLYHALAVNWVDEYGSVPGLGNLHSRLAFNFSLFPLAAFFDFWTFDQKVFHLICSFFFLLVGFYLLLSPFNWLLGDKRVFHLFNILVLIPLFDESSQHLASIQPNYISLLLSVFIISQVLQLMESEERLPAILYISAIVLYAVTIKLHMLPYLLIPIVCSALHWRELLAKRKVLFMSVMLLLIVLLLLIALLVTPQWR